VLALHGACKSWGDRPVLDQVDLEVPAGEIVRIAGGNGAGKTTLLRIAAGVILPEAGTVLFHGEDIERDRPGYQRRIGYLSAGDRGLYARLTVRQNLEFWGGLAGLSRRRRRRRLEDILADFEIGELADRRVDRLSMGQRQRVRLAMTFLHEPSMIFLDEPTTSLDAAGIEQIDVVLARVLAGGGAVLVVSPEAADPALERTWVLEAAELRAVAP
jgi:ABC-2 type transport system ATP-binding protein